MSVSSPRSLHELGQREERFPEGLLVRVAREFRSMKDGDELALSTPHGDVERDILLWSQLTGHPIVSRTPGPDGYTRMVLRKGGTPGEWGQTSPEARLWIYTNFHCNLSCDYCCVRSRPGADPRFLPLKTVRSVVREAVGMGVSHLYLTGGEPLLRPDIVEIVTTCTDSLPTTLLTNGTLLSGRRGDELEAVSRKNLTLQISLDSPEPAAHDLHRGAGSWERALHGIDAARQRGFHVKVAATVAYPGQADHLQAFLAAKGVPLEDLLVREVAHRGFSEGGISLSRAELVPEPAVTARGVYWHPVGADDDDFLVSRTVLPLALAFEEIRRTMREDRRVGDEVAQIFRCA